MAFLHLHNILHRDLKTNNVLLDEYFHPKICNFLTAKEADDIKTSQSIQQTTAKQMAPEFLDNWIKYNRTKPIDVYSFALLMYEIVTYDEPFEGDNYMQIIHKVMQKGRPEFKRPISNCYRRLIERCWSHEPEKRPTFDEIVYQLENDTDFITENSIDSNQYRKYIEYVKHPETISYEPDDAIQVEQNDDYLNFDFPPIDLTKFERLDKIEEGHLAKVYKVKEKDTDNLCM